MIVKGTTKIFGVVGNPISHSFSPVLHNFLFKKLGLNSIYIPIEVNKDKFETFILGMKNINNLVGLNITVPFKNDALKICDKLSDEAEVIGSVNTLYFKNGGIFGDNTDCYGFLESLKINFPEIKLNGSTVLVLGAGGAAKAVLYSLIREKVKKIFLINRTVAKAENLKEYFSYKTGFENFVVSELDENIPAEVDIIINTTSVGLKEEDELLIRIPDVNNIKLVYDLIYNPDKTKLLSQAEAKNINVINGKDMLILQALKSFEIWTSEKVFIFLGDIKKIL